MCENQPLRGNSEFHCERSIIGSDPAGRHHCAFKIVTGNVSEIWRAGSEAGSYVLSSVGERLIYCVK